MNHHILGLSSRSVSLTKYNLTFRTSRVAAVFVELQHIHQNKLVQDVDDVSVCVNVNSCRVVVAVWSVER